MVLDMLGWHCGRGIGAGYITVSTVAQWRFMAWRTLTYRTSSPLLVPRVWLVCLCLACRSGSTGKWTPQRAKS